MEMGEDNRSEKGRKREPKWEERTEDKRGGRKEKRSHESEQGHLMCFHRSLRMQGHIGFYCTSVSVCGIFI